MREARKNVRSRASEGYRTTRVNKKKIDLFPFSAGIIPNEGEEKDGVFRYHRMRIEISHGTHLHNTHTHTQISKKKKLSIILPSNEQEDDN